MHHESSHRTPAEPDLRTLLSSCARPRPVATEWRTSHDVHALQRRGTARSLLRRLRKAAAALAPAAPPGAARPPTPRERRHPARAPLPRDPPPAAAAGG